MLLKPCRCGRLIPYGQSYCDKCLPIVEAQREQNKRASDKRYNKSRDRKYIQFYNGKDWRVLSRTRLQYDGYKCVECGAIASEVDHIIPIQTPQGWELRLDFDNTRSLCTKCHNKKHKRFIKQAR